VEGEEEEEGEDPEEEVEVAEGWRRADGCTAR
jgi:hypothetical protein